MKHGRLLFGGLLLGLGTAALVVLLCRLRGMRARTQGAGGSARFAVRTTRESAVLGIRPPNIVLVGDELPVSPNLGDESSIETDRQDDLTRVEGIGPKVQQLLVDVGIATYSRLAETAVERLREILAAARLRMMDPATWPEQAALAARGDLEGLAQFQATLKAGRRAA